jgi:hypothetical protein
LEASNRQSDVTDTFTRHSSGSDGWSEVRRLEKCPRRDFPDLFAKRGEHQIARSAEHTANIRDLKTLALHPQVANYGDCRVAKLGASIRDNL